MLHSPDIGEFAGKFSDIPFILVGAGPSLDESIDFLKEVQERAIIVTSNSPSKINQFWHQTTPSSDCRPTSPTARDFRGLISDIISMPFSAYPEIVESFGKLFLVHL